MNESTALKASVGMESGEEWKKQLWRWKEMINTGLLPSHIKTPEQALLVSLKGEEMGLAPMRALHALIVIKGRVSMSAEGMLGLIRERMPGMELVIIKSTGEIASVKVKRKQSDEWSTVEFTRNDAITATLWGPTKNFKGQMVDGPWVHYPADMLWARCISRVARRIFPDIIQGAILPDEARGIVTQVEPEPKEESFGAMLESKVAESEDRVYPQNDTISLNIGPSEEEVDAVFEAQAKKMGGSNQKLVDERSSEDPALR